MNDCYRSGVNITMTLGGGHHDPLGFKCRRL